MITPEFIEENVFEWSCKREDAKYNFEHQGKHLPRYKQASNSRNFGDDQISPKLFDMLLKMFYKKLPNIDFKLNTYTQLAVQKYMKGDYITPHCDNYDWLYLMMLSNSEKDGLILENKEEDRLLFHKDEYEKVIEIKRDHMHWVNPVFSEVRYSAVLLCNLNHCSNIK